MKVADALQTVTRLFLDTAPTIYYVERNPAYTARVHENFNRIDAGTILGVTSPLTLAECLIVPIHQGLSQAQQDFTECRTACGGLGILARKVSGPFGLARMPTAGTLAVWHPGSLAPSTAAVPGGRPPRRGQDLPKGSSSPSRPAPATAPA